MTMKKHLLYLLFICLSTFSNATTFTVTSLNTSGAGSFMEAVDNANLNSGPDTVDFNISGMPPHVIVTAPIIVTDALIIDGTTQPDNGYTGTCPKIVLDASAIDPGVSGLLGIASQDVSIYGLWFKNFRNTNSTVISIAAPNVSIGATGKKNLFTNNVNSITINANDVEVMSNYFGCDCDGALAEPNTGIGIFGYSALQNISIIDNVIASNGEGVILGSSVDSSINMIVRANRIGTDQSGTIALGNTNGGITLRYVQDLIFGGVDSGQGNVVSGNGGVGCLLVSCSGTVFGNKIGTDISGTDTIPNDPLNTQYNTALNFNGLSGIICNMQVGGFGSGEQNVIVGNDIALNIADTVGYYEVLNNIIGQTLSGLTWPLQYTGIQVYYNTAGSRLENNYIYGSSAGFVSHYASNFIAMGNRVGEDLFANPLHLQTGFSMNNSDSFTIELSNIRNADNGLYLGDCNGSFLLENSIEDCQRPIYMNASLTTCSSNQMYRNLIANNLYTVDLQTGGSGAANDDIAAPTIEGSTADSTWGTSLPNATIDLARDITLDPTYPQGYDYSIPQIIADASGHWVYLGPLVGANEYTAMQTDVNNNSSEFSDRLSLGLTSLEIKQLSIYPVPASNYLLLKNLSATEMQEWQMFNSTGSLVLQGKFIGGSNEKIDIRKLASGYYFVKVFSAGSTFVLKCLKE